MSGPPKTMKGCGGSHEGADYVQWASGDVQNRWCFGLVLEDSYGLVLTVYVLV